MHGLLLKPTKNKIFSTTIYTESHEMYTSISCAKVEWKKKNVQRCFISAKSSSSFGPSYLPAVFNPVHVIMITINSSINIVQ